MLSTLGVGADVDIHPHINNSNNVLSHQRVFLNHCADYQGEHYVALLEELEDHIDFFSIQNNFVRSEDKADESAQVTRLEYLSS